jgi:hypothetical protein
MKVKDHKKEIICHPHPVVTFTIGDLNKFTDTDEHYYDASFQEIGSSTRYNGVSFFLDERLAVEMRDALNEVLPSLRSTRSVTLSERDKVFKKYGFTSQGREISMGVAVYQNGEMWLVAKYMGSVDFFYIIEAENREELEKIWYQDSSPCFKIKSITQLEIILNSIS